MMHKNFFRSMQKQEKREDIGSLKKAIELFLDGEGHDYKFLPEEEKFIVSRNMLSLDILKEETFAESIQKSLQNIYPKKSVREIKQVDDYQIEIYI